MYLRKSRWCSVLRGGEGRILAEHEGGRITWQNCFADCENWEDIDSLRT